MKNTDKKIMFLLMLFLFGTLGAIAQTLGFNYQAIIKADSSNSFEFYGETVTLNFLASSDVALRFSILNATGEKEYIEEHYTTTNALGEVNLTVGAGVSSQGDFSDIVWNGTKKQLSVEIDYTANGSSYQYSNTQDLLYLPHPNNSSNTGLISDIKDSIAVVQVNLAQNQTESKAADLALQNTIDILRVDIAANTNKTGITTEESETITSNATALSDLETTVNENKTATHTLQTIHGCDSVVTLNLTINNSVTSTDTKEHCDSYEWIDGNLYEESNSTATHTLQTIHGCDSVVSLNLTINNSNVGSSEVMVCETYTWEGQTITSSQDLTHTYTNVLGCDSVYTLKVTINKRNESCDVCQNGTYVNGDSDNDGVCDDLDKCAGFIDADDYDLNGIPDGCDTDDDGDGVEDDIDNCPMGEKGWTSNTLSDYDNDGCKDDHSEETSLSACMDSEACNFDVYADIEGTCIMKRPYFEDQDHDGKPYGNRLGFYCNKEEAVGAHHQWVTTCTNIVSGICTDDFCDNNNHEQFSSIIQDSYDCLGEISSSVWEVIEGGCWFIRKI